VELRVARVVSATLVAGSDKLLQLNLDPWAAKCARFLEDPLQLPRTTGRQADRGRESGTAQDALRSIGGHRAVR
jgi:hypothetical protein